MRTAKIGKVGNGEGRRYARHFTWVRAIGLFIGATAFCVASAFGQAASSHESAKSVVKIMSRFAGGKVESGSGFVWSQSDYVVTALHVVAGAASITVYSESLKKERDAEIIAVHQESDLALLKLKTDDLKLTPLKVASASPNLKEEHYIWGYPRDVNSMQGDDIRFSLSLEQQPTLGNIFKSQAQFESVVGKQGYPQYQAKILRVSSSIQPGHSGAPIFDKSGVVVGIGDGGLHQGIARINWAIPANVYLAGLPISKDPKPTAPSRQTNLYSSAVATPVEVKVGPRETETGAGQKESGEEEVLHLAWSTSLSEILATADEEDLEVFQEITKENSEHTGSDLSQAVIEVYEDYETGATIAVPQGVSFHYEKETRTLQAWSESQQVKMIIQIVNNETWEDGVRAKDDFDAYIESLDGDAGWQNDPDIPDEAPYYDENETYWSWGKSRILPDENGETYSQMYATLIIDDNDFLGTVTFVHNLQTLSPEDLKLFYLMMACVELSAFAIE